MATQQEAGRGVREEPNEEEREKFRESRKDQTG